MRKLIFIVGFLLAFQASSISQTPSDQAQEHFVLGLGHLRSGRFADAVESFKESSKLDPKRASVQYNLGVAYLALEKLSDASEAYKKAVNLDPNNSAYRAGLCTVLALSKNFDQAKKECDEGKRIDPDSPIVEEAFIRLMQLSGRSQREIATRIESALLRFGEDAAFIIFSADFYFQNANFQYAAELFERLVRLQPDVSSFHGKLAYSYYRLNRESEAVESARRSIALEPKDPFSNFVMGSLLAALGLNTEARDALLVAAASGKVEGAHYVLALAEKRRGDNYAALAAIEQAISNEPDEYTYLTEKGEILTSLARYEEAIAPLRRAVELKQNDPITKLKLGMALMESANYSEGIAILEIVNQQMPGNSLILMFLDVARNRQFNHSEIPQMVERVRVDPGSLKAKVDLVVTLLYARRLDEAMSHLQRIREMDARDADRFVSLAISLSTAGKLDEALEFHKRALEIREDASAYLGLADIYKKRGEIDKAIASFRKVLAMKPDSPGILKLFGDLLLENGLRQEALETYKRSRALKPNEPIVLYLLSVLSFKLGNELEGRQYLAELRQLDRELASKIDRFTKLRFWF